MVIDEVDMDSIRASRGLPHPKTWNNSTMMDVIDTLDARNERSVGIAVALEQETAELRRLLTTACGYLVSENAYDMTELLDECYALGIIEVYDGVIR